MRTSIETGEIPTKIDVHTPDQLREALDWRMARYIETSTARIAVMRGIGESLVAATFEADKKKTELFRHSFSESVLLGQTPMPAAGLYKSAFRNVLGYPATRDFPVVRTNTVHDYNGVPQRKWNWGMLGVISIPGRDFGVFEGTGQRPDNRPYSRRTWINHEQVGMIAPVSGPYVVRYGGGLRPVDLDAMYAALEELPIDNDSTVVSSGRPSRTRRVA